jgi:hypothetical protein
MLKKLTIAVDADVYEGPRSVVGPRRIGRLLSAMSRPNRAVAETAACGHQENQ